MPSRDTPGPRPPWLGSVRSAVEPELPRDVSWSAVSEAARALGIEQSATRIVVGVRASDPPPVVVDFGATPHLVAFGEPGAGKTTLLRTLVRGIAETTRPDEARVVVIDYRRTLLGVLEGGHLAGYATSEQSGTALIRQVAEYLSARGAASDAGGGHRGRTGPEIYVVVDDYELVRRGGSDDALTPLVRCLARSRDIGLHVVMAYRTLGTPRGLEHCAIGALNEADVSTLLLPGIGDEAVPTALHPGRGVLVSHTGGREAVQIANSPGR
ncbi:FtsK/SpoIIIE domain-containing protein [Nocardia sp. NPDC003693]